MDASIPSSSNRTSSSHEINISQTSEASQVIDSISQMNYLQVEGPETTLQYSELAKRVSQLASTLSPEEIGRAVTALTWLNHIPMVDEALTALASRVPVIANDLTCSQVANLATVFSSCKLKDQNVLQYTMNFLASRTVGIAQTMSLSKVVTTLIAFGCFGFTSTHTKMAIHVLHLRRKELGVTEQLYHQEEALRSAIKRSVIEAPHKNTGRTVEFLVYMSRFKPLMPFMMDSLNVHLERLTLLAHRLNASELEKAALALADMLDIPTVPVAMTAIASHVPAFTGELTSSQLTSLVTAFAKAGIRNDTIELAINCLAVSIARIASEMPPQEATHAHNAFVKLGVTHLSTQIAVHLLKGRMATAPSVSFKTESSRGPSVNEAIDFMSVMFRLGNIDLSLVNTCVERILERANYLTAEETTKALLALSPAAHIAGVPEALSAIASHIPAVAPQMKHSEIAFTIKTLFKHHMAHVPLLEALGQRLLILKNELTADEASFMALIFSTANIHAATRTAILNALAERTSALAEQLTAMQVSNLVKAFCQSRIQSAAVTQAMNALAVRTVDVANVMNPSQLSCVVSVLFLWNIDPAIKRRAIHALALRTPHIAHNMCAVTLAGTAMAIVPAGIETDTMQSSVNALVKRLPAVIANMTPFHVAATLLMFANSNVRNENMVHAVNLLAAHITQTTDQLGLFEVNNAINALTLFAIHNPITLGAGIALVMRLHQLHGHQPPAQPPTAPEAAGAA